MKRDYAIQLNNALHTEGLKVKHLTGEQYVKLLNLKRPLAKYANEMSEEEKELFKEYNIVTNSDLLEQLKDKKFTEKRDAIYSKEFEPIELNFLDSDVFKKFTDDVDFGVASILAEYLLKG